VVIWSFISIHKEESDGSVVSKSGSLDFDCVPEMIATLDQEGFDNTLHLVSFGRWNGPHLEAKMAVAEWYQLWKGHIGDLFHGIECT
jgi:hypothetical protein